VSLIGEHPLLAGIEGTTDTLCPETGVRACFYDVGDVSPPVGWDSDSAMVPH